MKQRHISDFFKSKSGTSASSGGSASSSSAATTKAAPAPTAAASTVTAARKRMQIVDDDSDNEPQSSMPAKQQAAITTVTTTTKENDDDGNSAAGSSSTSSAVVAPAKRVKTEKETQPPSSSSSARAPSSPVVAAAASGSSADADAEAEVDADADADDGSPVIDIENDVTRDIPWPVGQPTPFAAVTAVFEAIENTTKRLEILSILTTFFAKLIRQSPQDLIQCVYLCINRLGPTWEEKELGIGESVLMKAIASSTGRSVKAVKEDLLKRGDLGKVAQAARSNQPTMFRPKPLTVPSVFKTLKEISEFTGNSSMQRKIDKIKYLLVACQGRESRYLVRALEGKLRIGLAEQSVLVALAHASIKTRGSKMDPAEASATLKNVYNECPTYERIIPVLLDRGIEKLAEHCKLTPGVPLKPMLAHPTKAISEILDRFQDISFTCEYKYDGERAQIHRNDAGKTMIFSRNQENLSQKYPDIIEHMKLVPKANVRSFVMDTEAVAWDREKKHILPFQVLSTRKRKDVDTKTIAVQVCVFAFDLLYLNGESLTKKPLEERRRLMRESFTEREGEFTFAKAMNGQSVEEIQTFLDESVSGNCEGLMVKTLGADASYEPSKRSRNWLKVKKDYLDGVGDSLDLVVIGAYHGKGKRTGVYGGFLLACYDPDREEYQAIAKIGTGFSEEDLANMTKAFKPTEMVKPKSYYAVTDQIKPDVWLEPTQVWEVRAADLSISPVYCAGRGLVDANKGISLRFPRFVRIRDDKTPDNSTSSDQVADMYRSQNINHGFGGGAGGGGGLADDEY